MHADKQFIVRSCPYNEELPLFNEPLQQYHTTVGLSFDMTVINCDIQFNI